MKQSDVKWSREAFISTLPKKCLKCCRVGVSVKSRILEKHLGFGTKSVIRLTAICLNYDCQAMYAQQSSDDEWCGQGYTCGRGEVIFVHSLPYHISLGGEAGRILSDNDFAKPLTAGIDFIEVVGYRGETHRLFLTM